MENKMVIYEVALAKFDKLCANTPILSCKKKLDLLIIVMNIYFLLFLGNFTS